MQIVQLVVDGLLLGGILALSALGFNIIFGVMRVVNLAHGDFVVLGAILTALAYGRWHMNPLLMLPVTALLGFVLGVLIQRYLLRNLPREIASGEASSLTLTFGLSYFIAGAGLALFGGDFRSVPALTGGLQIAGISVSTAKAAAFATAIAVALLLGAFMRVTTIGRAIRAASQNADGAMACGVDTDVVRTLAFGLGTAVACGSGTLLGLIYSLNPQMGVAFTISAFAVVAVGGLGSYAGAILGAVVLGLVQSFTSYYAGAKIAEAAPYVAFILVLLFLPSGLLGRRSA